MKAPTPDDMEGVRLWDCYIVAQVAMAAAGIIPRHARAMSVEVEGMRVVIHFQLTEIDEEDREDMDDILSEFRVLVGLDVDSVTSYEIHATPPDSRGTGVYWLFFAREFAT